MRKLGRMEHDECAPWCDHDPANHTENCSDAFCDGIECHKKDDMRTVEQEWDIYVKMVYPDRLTPNSDQYIELRRAFYAGNASMFGLMNHVSIYPEDRAVQALSKLRKEIVEFNKQVQLGAK
jgi:hypothetical protein